MTTDTNLVFPDFFEERIERSDLRNILMPYETALRSELGHKIFIVHSPYTGEPQAVLLSPHDFRRLVEGEPVVTYSSSNYRLKKLGDLKHALQVEPVVEIKRTTKSKPLGYLLDFGVYSKHKALYKLPKIRFTLPEDLQEYAKSSLLSLFVEFMAESMSGVQTEQGHFRRALRLVKSRDDYLREMEKHGLPLATPEPIPEEIAKAWKVIWYQDFIG